jgi:16S rRNA (guanine527-N7)-methyltransferase
MELIRKYFPGLTIAQLDKFSRLLELYPEWNRKINVISRKDISLLEERHILHSLSPAKIIHFSPGTEILDAGIGGGLPGIPLAILFPDSEFLLVDSVGKKISVANAIIKELDIHNVSAVNTRYENLQRRFDFILGRAVTNLNDFTTRLRKLIKPDDKNSIENGFLYLKGGEVMEELKGLHAKYSIRKISDFFSEEFFETKKIIHLYNFR